MHLISAGFEPEAGGESDASKAAGKLADEQQDLEIAAMAERKRAIAAQEAQAMADISPGMTMAPWESEFRGSTREFELMEYITQPYWRRDTRLWRVDPWEVGDPSSNPEIGGAPEATATPRHNGSATSATTMEAGRSARQLCKILLKVPRFVPSIAEIGRFARRFVHMLKNFGLAQSSLLKVQPRSHTSIRK